MQKFLSDVREIRDVFTALGVKKALLCCDAAFSRLEIRESVRNAAEPFVLFDAVTPNPRYEDAARGAALLRGENCDAILAVGGGSTLDTAKCIKFFSQMDPARQYLRQEYVPNGIPLLAVPTTAGTGSESTRFAVLYEDGEKRSLAHDDLLPTHVLLEPLVLKTLPQYQKKCAMLDALCQAIEAWWSVRSTVESRILSQKAVALILRNMEAYLAPAFKSGPAGSVAVYGQMLAAANLSGQAIHIAQTTAAHAMSYKLTALYGLPHGHAVALCLPALWRWMLSHISLCTDPRGLLYLLSVFSDIATALGAPNAAAAILFLERLRDSLGLTPPESPRAGELELLADTVNPLRLKNNPIPVDRAAALQLYAQILRLPAEQPRLPELMKAVM